MLFRKLSKGGKALEESGFYGGGGGGGVMMFDKVSQTPSGGESGYA